MSDTYDLDSRPPCWEPGTQCPNGCARDHYRRVVDNHVSLSGPWAGWRLAGRDLVPRVAKESRNAGCAVCSGVPMHLIYVTRHEKGTRHEKPVSGRW